MAEQFAKIGEPKVPITPEKKPADWFKKTDELQQFLEKWLGKTGAGWITANMKIIGWDSDDAVACLESHRAEIVARTDLIWGSYGRTIDMGGKKLPVLDSLMRKAYSPNDTPSQKGEKDKFNSEKYNELLSMVALTYIMQDRAGVPADVFQAIAMQETKFHYSVSSSAGAGLFQMTATGVAINFTDEKDKANNVLEDWGGHEPLSKKLGKHFDANKGEWGGDALVVRAPVEGKDGKIVSAWKRGAHFKEDMLNPGISIVYAAACMLVKGATPDMGDAEVKAMAKKYNGNQKKMASGVTFQEDYSQKVLAYYKWLTEPSQIALNK